MALIRTGFLTDAFPLAASSRFIRDRKTNSTITAGQTAKKDWETHEMPSWTLEKWILFQSFGEPTPDLRSKNFDVEHSRGAIYQIYCNIALGECLRQTYCPAEVVSAWPIKILNGFTLVALNLVICT